MPEAFMVCMGGSGTRFFEALIHMAALGVWSTEQFSAIHVLVVDADAGNGNMVRSTQAYQLYENMYRNFQQKNGFFHIPISLYQWIPVQVGDKNGIQLCEMHGNNEDAMLLSKVLYTHKEEVMQINQGFRGHPNVGVIFMDKLLKAEADGPRENDFWKFMVQLKEKGDRVLLVGSCFGGTGAAALPIMGKFIRDQLGADKVQIGAFIFLPTFTLPTPPESEDINPNSNDFTNKVKTVLNAYHMSAYWVQNGKKLFNQMFLLGSPMLVEFNNYSPGKSSQRNPATIFEVLACSAIPAFFLEDIATKDTHGIYLTRLEKGFWNWELYSNRLFASLKQNVAILLQVSAVFFTEIYTSNPSTQNVKCLLSLVCLQGLGEKQRGAFDTEIDQFAKYLSTIIQWIFQIATHLPAGLGDELPGENETFHNIKYSDLQAQIKTNPESAIREAESLMRQRLFDASVLCKLENLRQTRTPLEEDKLDLQNQGIIKILIQVFSEKNRSDLGSSLNQMIGHPYLNRALDSGRIASILRNLPESYTSQNKDDSGKNLIRPSYYLVQNLIKSVASYYR